MDTFPPHDGFVGTPEGAWGCVPSVISEEKFPEVFFQHNAVNRFGQDGFIKTPLEWPRGDKELAVLKTTKEWSDQGAALIDAWEVVWISELGMKMWSILAYVLYGEE